MKYIYTIVTGSYKYYFNDFLSTIKNFYKDEDKILVILSDSLDEYDGKYVNRCNIVIDHIHNTFAKILLVDKFNILEDAMIRHSNDEDTIFYFDIDTRFTNNGLAEKLIEDKVQNGLVNFSRHIHELRWPNWVIHGNNGIYLEAGPDNHEYVTISKSCANFSVIKENREIITSFFFCKRQSFIKFNKYVNKLIHTDVNNLMLLPLNEEDYVNFIWYQQYSNEINERYIECSEEFFITENWEYLSTLGNECNYYSDNYGTYKLNDSESSIIFINQKYDVKHKKK